MEELSGELVMGRFEAQAHIDRAEALRYLGHTGQELDPELSQRLETQARACEEGLSPAYAWRTFAIAAFEPGEITLEGTSLTLPGADIAERLQGASHVVLLACTLGMGCERMFNQLKVTGAVDAMLYSACCNAFVESCADEAQERITTLARENGLFACTRFRPGYGDLPLAIQPAFLEAVNATRLLGLSTTPSDMLMPTKSVTAIVGLFKELPPYQSASPCQYCGSKDFCFYLQRGITCHGL